MRRMLAAAVVVAVLIAGLAGLARAQPAQADQAALKQTLYNLDISIDSLRKGLTGEAKSHLRDAFALYSIGLNRDGRIENTDSALHTRISESFNSLSQSPEEDNIRTLRADVELAASKIGISLSFFYRHALFVILLISLVFSVIVTLISKRVVNWERVKQIKAEVGDWQKKLLDAQRKRDFKTVHKLQQDQGRIFSLQGEVMRASFKPTIFYIVPYFLLWWLLSKAYADWTVAWLPFSLPLPFVGTMGSLGFLGWFLLSYFGLSYIVRKLLIGD